MDQYYIHPQVKVLESIRKSKLIISNKINCDFSNTQFELGLIEDISRDFGYEVYEDKGEVFNLVFKIVETPWLYEINTSDCIVIRASNEVGLFKGMQTVLKYLSKYGYMYQGIIKDKPSLSERGFHLDCARKYFPKSWIQTLIKRLSWMGFNSLEIHFSENLGLRLENNRFTQLLSSNYLSKDDLNDILKTAKNYHVSIIPSLDSPGHLRHILQQLPDYSLPGSENEALDISNPLALAFIKDFYTDYSSLFKEQKYFNLGSDEFIDFETFDDYPVLEEYAKKVLRIQDGTGYDTYIHYINTMVEFLENKGYKVRLWNDGLFRTNQKSSVELSKSVEICYWTKYNKYMAPLSVFEEAGYPLVNYHAENFYYTLHPEGGIKIIDPKLWYESWNPNIFSFQQVANEETHVIGAFYSLWCDAPELQTPEEIGECLLEPLMAFSQLTWSGNASLSLETLRKDQFIYEID